MLNTGGSSSGAGTAANFWAANVGTETSGSILSPANQNMLAAIKPTVGRISRYGVIPITADQDTAGPMAKTVTDAAILMGVLESASPDPNDPATKTCQAPPNRDYTPFLKREALKGARIGIPRANYYDRITLPGEKEPRGGLNERAGQVDGRRDRDPEEGRRHRRRRRHPERRRTRIRRTTSCCGAAACDKGPRDPNCSSVLWYGMKRDFNAWLASLGPAAPVKTLAELRAFNTRACATATRSSTRRPISIDPMRWISRRIAPSGRRTATRTSASAATQGIDEVLKAHKLDALRLPRSRAAPASPRSQATRR